MAPSVAYLGHVIDAEGLHPLPNKVHAIQQAPTPKNVTELKSYQTCQLSPGLAHIPLVPRFCFEFSRLAAYLRIKIWK